MLGEPAAVVGDVANTAALAVLEPALGEHAQRDRAERLAGWLAIAEALLGVDLALDLLEQLLGLLLLADQEAGRLVAPLPRAVLEAEPELLAARVDGSHELLLSLEWARLRARR
jgi:hypothetical protein